MQDTDVFEQKPTKDTTVLPASQHICSAYLDRREARQLIRGVSRMAHAEQDGARPRMPAGHSALRPRWCLQDGRAFAQAKRKKWNCQCRSSKVGPNHGPHDWVIPSGAPSQVRGSDPDRIHAFPCPHIP